MLRISEMVRKWTLESTAEEGGRGKVSVATGEDPAAHPSAERALARALKKKQAASKIQRFFKEKVRGSRRVSVAHCIAVFLQTEGDRPVSEARALAFLEKKLPGTQGLAYRHVAEPIKEWREKNPAAFKQTMKKANAPCHLKGPKSAAKALLNGNHPCQNSDVQAAKAPLAVKAAMKSGRHICLKPGHQEAMARKRWKLDPDLAERKRKASEAEYAKDLRLKKKGSVMRGPRWWYFEQDFTK